MSGTKRSGGERSNIYSESKCTNWSQYDPFDLEISSLPEHCKPEASTRLKSGSISIYIRDLHPEFIHPVNPEDVKSLLDKVPPEFLNSLHSIYLLGGTSKQLKASKKSFRYGCYRGGGIYLYAYPRWMLKEKWGKRPSPTAIREYEQMGAKWIQDKSCWWLEFDRISLKRFYLYDVLLHELGHHVDRRRYHSSGRFWNRDTASAERYAEWFSQKYTRIIEQESMS